MIFVIGYILGILTSICYLFAEACHEAKMHKKRKAIESRDDYYGPLG